ncbi:hypothetical protein, partial [Staphylococcus aureus]
AVLETYGGEKEAAAEGVYFSGSISRADGDVIVKIVNSRGEERHICLELSGKLGNRGKGRGIQAVILTGGERDAHNSI